MRGTYSNILLTGTPSPYQEVNQEERNFSFNKGETQKVQRNVRRKDPRFSI